LTNVALNILETGHFALEDYAEAIAGHIKRFHVSLAAGAAAA